MLCCNPHEGLQQQFQPPLASLPESYQEAKNYHLALDPAKPPMHLLQALHKQTKASGGKLRGLDGLGWKMKMNNGIWGMEVDAKARQASSPQLSEVVKQL